MMMQASYHVSHADISDIPDAYIGPITGKIMQDPVVAADGWSYERPAFQKWLSFHATSPVSGAPLIHQTFTSNRVLSQQIRQFQDNNPTVFSQPTPEDILKGIQHCEQKQDHAPAQEDPSPLLSLLCERTMKPKKQRFKEAVRTFQKGLHHRLHRLPKAQWDPQASATFTATLLRACRKNTLEDVYSHPKHYGIPRTCIPSIQRQIIHTPTLSGATFFPHYSKQLEDHLFRVGTLPEDDELLPSSEVQDKRQDTTSSCDKALEPIPTTLSYI